MQKLFDHCQPRGYDHQVDFEFGRGAGLESIGRLRDLNLLEQNVDADGNIVSNKPDFYILPQCVTMWIHEILHLCLQGDIDFRQEG